MNTNRVWPAARAAIAISIAALVAACAGEDAQSIEGQVARSNFESRVLGVRAVRGGEAVAWAEVGEDGRFQIDVPVGDDYRLEVVTENGPRSFVTRSDAGGRNLVFDVCGAEAPFDVGHVHGWNESDPGGGDGEHDCDEPCMDTPDGSCEDPCMKDPGLCEDPCRVDPTLCEDPCEKDPDLCQDPCQTDPGMCEDPCREDPSLCEWTCDDQGNCCYPDGTCCDSAGTCCYPDGTCCGGEGCCYPDGSCDPPPCDPDSGENCEPPCDRPNPDGTCEPPPCDPATGENCEPPPCDPMDPDNSGCEPPPCDPTNPDNGDCEPPPCDRPNPDGTCEPPPCENDDGTNCCDPGDNDPMCWPEPEPPPCDDNRPDDECWAGGVVPENDVPNFGCEAR